jgi:hypothetical protein
VHDPGREEGAAVLGLRWRPEPLGLLLGMSWQDKPGPARPTMQSLVEEELHLVLYCNRCNREVRITPWEAVEMFGADCTMIGARRKMKCSWYGERHSVEARPCTLDRDTKNGVWNAERYIPMWPADAHGKERLAQARVAWELRSPQSRKKDFPMTKSTRQE